MSERRTKAARPVRRGWPGIIAALVLLGSGAPAHATGPALLALDQGCGRPAPAAPPSSIAVDGRSRALITVLPQDYDAEEPHALVVAFHGRTSSNATVRGYYDLERHARTPTIFVYPAGRREPGGGYSWSDPGETGAALRDYALFDAVLALMARSYCLDPERIFAVGHSLGGWFANSLACARGEVLRAVGSVAGGVNRSACRGAVAALLFHNPQDRLVAFAYGLEARDLFRAHNRAAGAGGRIALGGFACRHYPDPAAVHPVVWCPHTRDRSRNGRYYPHHWPVGTGAAVMGFFQALPAAATTSGATFLAAAPGG